MSTWKERYDGLLHENNMQPLPWPRIAVWAFVLPMALIVWVITLAILLAIVLGVAEAITGSD
jgi:hypothetical protein